QRGRARNPGAADAHLPRLRGGQGSAEENAGDEAMTHRILLALAVLLPPLALAQPAPEGQPPKMETRPNESELTPTPNAAPPVKKYVEEVRQMLDKPPPAEG